MLGDKYDDRKWLFTTNSADLRGNLAAKAFFYPNQAAAVEFMLAKNYDDKRGARDSDVHEDFVKFIVDAGLHARAIDQTLGKDYEPASKFDAQAKDILAEVIGASNKDIDITKPEKKQARDENLSKILPPTGLTDDIRFLFNKIVGDIKNINLSDKYNDDVKARRESAVEDMKEALSRVARVNAPFVKADSGTAKTVYDNVYGRWNELSKETQDFYDRFIELQKVINGEWKQAPVAEYGMARSNLGQYRLNLKKDKAGGELLLAKYIVDYDPKVFTGVRVNGITISNADLVTKLGDKVGRIFGNLYQQVYEGKYEDTAALKPKMEDSKEVRFGVNVDELVRKRFFAISQAQISELPSVPGVPERYAYLDMKNNNVIYRNADGKFMRKLANGDKVEYGMEDDLVKDQLKAAHQCYGTNVYGNDQEKCRKFIFECLLSQEANSLKACLDGLKGQADFFNVAVKDISNLHPVLALRILQQFGFHKYKEDDSAAGMQLWKVESVAHWLETFLAKKYSTKELHDMIKEPDQANVLAYLDLVSQYVNANPSILNKQYSGSSDEAMGKLEKLKSAYGKQLGLQWEIPKPNATFILSDIGRLKSHFQQLRVSRNLPFMHISGQRGLYTPYGRQLTPGMSFLQTGGGGKCDLVFKRLNESGHVSGAQIIEGYMNAVINEFASRNKTLDANSKKNIEANIQKYRELEIELQRTLCYIDEFNTLSDVLQDYNSKILTEESLKKFVDRYSHINTKTQSTEGVLIDIISKIQDAMGKDATGPTNPVKVNDWM